MATTDLWSANAEKSLEGHVRRSRLECDRAVNPHVANSNLNSVRIGGGRPLVTDVQG